MELGWVRDNDLMLGADDYLRLVLKKTAWYSFIHPRQQTPTSSSVRIPQDGVARTR